MKNLTYINRPNAQNDAEKIKIKTKKFLKGYKIKIKMKYLGTGINGTFIYRIRLSKGKKAQTFFDLIPEIQRYLRLPCVAYEDDYEIHLSISGRKPEKINLTDTLVNPTFTNHLRSTELPVVIGYDFRGEAIIEDFASSINLLIGGLPGTGKSVLLRCLIFNLIVSQPPDKVNLLLIDVGSKASIDDADLTIFNGVPHMSADTADDIETAIYYISALNSEMNRRYSEHDAGPFIVCIIDEFSSLIARINDKLLREKFVGEISDLLKRGRKAKIIMVLAAQNPTQELMKIEIANIVTRISFRCAKPQNSITVLGEAGAESLQGQGVMLFKSPKYYNAIRLQGAYLEPYLIGKVVSSLAAESYDVTGNYTISLPESMNSLGDSIQSEQLSIFSPSPIKNSNEKSICTAILWALKQETISVNKYVAEFHVGSKNASHIIEELTQLGIVSEAFSKQPRQVLIKEREKLPDVAKALLRRNGIQNEDEQQPFIAKEDSNE